MSRNDSEEQANFSEQQMSNLSRRKILVGIGGGIGAGALLGGGATWTLLQDQETFANNQMVAGELDLKATWQQTYNGEPVNAFPDEDGDGVQDPIRTRQQIATDAGLPIDSPSVEKTFRDQFADVPDDIEAPVIDLGDMKPGDDGTITFGIHLFDNPGLVTMQGELLENAENERNEPERDTMDPLSNSGELASLVQAEIVDETGTKLFEGNLRELLFTLARCGLPSGPLENSTTRETEVRWRLPDETEDEIQTDSASFRLSFVGEQARHNPKANPVPEAASSHLKKVGEPNGFDGFRIMRIGLFNEEFDPGWDFGGFLGPRQQVDVPAIPADRFKTDRILVRAVIEDTRTTGSPGKVCAFVGFTDDTRRGEIVGVDGGQEGCLSIQNIQGTFRQGGITGEEVDGQSTINWPDKGANPPFRDGLNGVDIFLPEFGPDELFILDLRFEINAGGAGFDHCPGTTITGTIKGHGHLQPDHIQPFEDKITIEF